MVFVCLGKDIPVRNNPSALHNAAVVINPDQIHRSGDRCHPAAQRNKSGIIHKFQRLIDAKIKLMVTCNSEFPPFWHNFVEFEGSFIDICAPAVHKITGRNDNIRGCLPNSTNDPGDISSSNRPANMYVGNLEYPNSANFPWYLPGRDEQKFCSETARLKGTVNYQDYGEYGRDYKTHGGSWNKITYISVGSVLNCNTNKIIQFNKEGNNTEKQQEGHPVIADYRNETGKKIASPPFPDAHNERG